MNRVSSSPAIACGQRKCCHRKPPLLSRGRWHPTDPAGRRRVRHCAAAHPPPQQPCGSGVRDPEDPSDQCETERQPPGVNSGLAAAVGLHGVEVHLPDDTHGFREGFVRDAVEHQQAVVPGICDSEITVNDRDAGG